MIGAQIPSERDESLKVNGDGAEVCFPPATNYSEFSLTGNPSLQQHILLHNIWDHWSNTPFSKEPEIKSRVVMVTSAETTGRGFFFVFF